MAASFGIASFGITVSRRAAIGAAVLAAAGCGGGGGDDGPPQPPPAGSTWVAGSFLPASTFEGRCVAPRSGTNPQTSQPFTDVQGTALDEKNWLRSWSNDLYLWYDEIIDRDPAPYTVETYFDLLKTPAVTPSGNQKDRFHFTYRTTDWVQLIQSGTEAGYGAVWSVVANLPPRRIVVAYTHAGSPAANANVQRGEEVIRVDGVDVVNSNTQAEVDILVAGLFPEDVNEAHTLVLRNPQTNGQRTVTLVSTTVAIDAVQNVGTMDTPLGPVGYIQFNDHIPSAEQELIDAFATLEQANVTDVVLDLRYNGGGVLAMASEIAYMIAGDVPTSGQTFERLQFNDKHQSINPITGTALTPMPFFNGSSQGVALPSLNLPRVFVLTGSMTCSASESIINGLRGVGVEVIQIGSTTCGKPYGFYPTDNCGTTYFTVQFQGVNAAGFGDYGDGFAPNNAPGAASVRLPGCSVRDDFGHNLGDPAEERFAAALAFRESQGQTCPLATGVSGTPSFSKPTEDGLAPAAPADGTVRKPPWLTNRIVDLP